MSPKQQSLILLWRDGDVLPVQHLGAGSLQLLQNLWQLSVIIAGGAPAQDPGQVVPGAQRKNSQLTLRQQNTMSLLQRQRSAIRSVVVTCLCSVRASISDRTQPTLPSPPHTRILKVSNFWKRRRLTEEHESHPAALPNLDDAAQVQQTNIVFQLLTSHPRCGPPFIRSNTCAGFNSCLKRRRNLTP